MSHEVMREVCEEAMKSAAHGATQGMGMAAGAAQGMAHGSSAALNMAKGAGMTMAGYYAGKGVVGRLLRHPLVLLSIGAAAGYLVHKYRNEIIASATKVSDAGRDFVQQRRESLADIIEEAKEVEEGKGGE